MSNNLTLKPRRNENQERFIKRFLKKTKKLGIIEEIKDRRHYKKPSDIKRRARQKAIARHKKEEAKRKKD
jgi:small subunit ribosomal protein S21|tara:strand:- start:352 stop:561 length:210 start_codon:yes stop_codon:yes gene_type:complete